MLSAFLSVSMVSNASKISKSCLLQADREMINKITNNLSSSMLSHNPKISQFKNILKNNCVQIKWLYAGISQNIGLF